MKIFYWSPFISKVATVSSVIRSAESIIKYCDTKKKIDVSIIDAIGEWDNYRNNISNKIIVREIDLNPHINLVTPLQRLVTGNFDRNSLFILRILTLELLAKQQGRATRGLMGGRTNLLPHQVYIAKEIG